MTLFVQASAGAVADGDDRLGFSLRAMNAIDSLRVYLAQAFWPSGLAVFYPHPMANLTAARVLPAAVLLVAVTGFPDTSKRSPPPAWEEARIAPPRSTISIPAGRS